MIERGDRDHDRNRISLPTRQSRFLAMVLVMMGVAAMVVIAITMFQRFNILIGRCRCRTVLVRVMMME